MYRRGLQRAFSTGKRAAGSNPPTRRRVAPVRPQGAEASQPPPVRPARPAPARPRQGDGSAAASGGHGGQAPPVAPPAPKSGGNGLFVTFALLAPVVGLAAGIKYNDGFRSQMYERFPDAMASLGPLLGAENNADGGGDDDDTGSPAPAKSSPKQDSKAGSKKGAESKSHETKPAAAKPAAPAKGAGSKQAAAPAPAKATAGKEEKKQKKAEADSAKAEAKSKQKKQEGKAVQSEAEDTSAESKDEDAQGEEKTPQAQVEPRVHERIQAFRDEMNRLEMKGNELRKRVLSRGSAAVDAELNAVQRELDATLLADLDDMSESELRLRIAALARELHTRTKWEGIRLQEAMRHAQEETSAHYNAVVQQQSDRFEEALRLELQAQEARLQRAVNAAAEDAAEDAKRAAKEAQQRMYADLHAQFQNEAKRQISQRELELSEEWEERLRTARQEAADEAARLHEERIQELQELRAEVGSLRQRYASASSFGNKSQELQRLSVAVLALASRTEEAAPLRDELRALRDVGASDPVVLEALNAISTKACRRGVPTTVQLAKRFDRVRKAARTEALVPEQSPGMAGHLIASVFAALTIPPVAPQAGDDTESILSRAQGHIDAGDLPAAVRETAQLKGLPAQVAQDWLADARDRLALEQTINMLKSHIRVRCAGMEQGTQAGE